MAGGGGVTSMPGEPQSMNIDAKVFGSAGVTHTLSLKSRFQRLPNDEGTIGLWEVNEVGPESW